MPTVLRIGPYRFSFFSIDCKEPQHVHVVCDRIKAKIWLNPVRIAKNEGFKPVELRKVLRLTEANREILLERWHGYCNG